MLLENIQGERKAASNVQTDGRSGPYSETIVNDVGLGRYFEAARNARLFSSFVKTVTVAATHNSPIAAATATPVLGLFNPAASGRAAVLLRLSCGTISGTPAGGQFVLNSLPVTTPTTATQTGAIFSNLLRDTATPQGSVCKVYNNVALAGIVPVVSNELALVGQATAAAAAGNGGPGGVGEDTAGLFIAPPGILLALMAGTGAGTTWIVNASWSWAEVDWPL